MEELPNKFAHRDRAIDERSNATTGYGAVSGAAMGWTPPASHRHQQCQNEESNESHSSCRRSPTVNATTIAVDLAKTVFELAISDEQGHWARTFQAQGHEVKRLPPQPVRPSVRRNKTDRADAAALWEADRCGDLLPVPVKTVGQQGLQGLHRVRSAWMATRTDRLNTTRGLLREFGLDLPQGPAAVLTQVPTWLADPESPIPLPLRTALTELIAEIRTLDTRIAAIEQQLREQAKPRPEIQRLMAVPGMGLLIATALIAAVGGMTAFRDGRPLAAWLGLTPHESSSGPRRHLGGISKRGDPYIRTLLVSGARSLLNSPSAPQWARQMLLRRPVNVVVVALANKLARTAWALVAHDGAFDRRWGRPDAVGTTG